MEHSTGKTKLQLKDISILSWDMSRTEIEDVLVAGVADNKIGAQLLMTV